MDLKNKYFYVLTLSSSPHVHGKNRTWNLMLDVIIALIPALLWGIITSSIMVDTVSGLFTKGAGDTVRIRGISTVFYFFGLPDFPVSACPEVPVISAVSTVPTAGFTVF